MERKINKSVFLFPSGKKLLIVHQNNKKTRYIALHYSGNNEISINYQALTHKKCFCFKIPLAFILIAGCP